MSRRKKRSGILKSVVQKHRYKKTLKRDLKKIGVNYKKLPRYKKRKRR